MWKKLYFICCCLICFSAKADVLPPDKFKTGYATVSGQLLSPASTTDTLRFELVTSLTDFNLYTASIGQDGQFSIQVPLGTERQIGAYSLFRNNRRTASGMLLLDQTADVFVKIAGKDGGDTVMVQDKLPFAPQDFRYITRALGNFEEGHTFSVTARHYQLPDSDYLAFEMDSVLPGRIRASLSNYPLSAPAREWLVSSFQTRYIAGRLFYYQKDASRKTGTTVKEPPLGYYSFLKRFDLNNPKRLYDLNINAFLNRFLSIEAFQIPPIGETPVTQWMEQVSGRIKEVVGFESGIFYEWLATASYLQQLDDQKQPLSDKQLKVIKNCPARYADMRETLLATNERLLQELHKNKDLYLGTLPADTVQLIERILSRHPGKPVVIDIWGTWCQPCMMAHQQMEHTVQELKKQGVVFVYLADEGSPQALWEGKIKGIGGEHYYLNRQQAQALYRTIGLEGFPTYLIYGRKHNLQHHITGFPGVETLKHYIEEVH